MNSKGHLYSSLVKSAFRIIGAIIAVVKQNYVVGFLLFGIAEILGILEELVDKR